MKSTLNLTQYRKKINDACSVVILSWLSRLLKSDLVIEIIKKIKTNDWCIVDLKKNSSYHKNLNKLVEKSSKIQWLMNFLKKHQMNKSKRYNKFIIFSIYLVVYFMIWLISLLISAHYLQTLFLLFIMHLTTSLLEKRLIL